MSRRRDIRAQRKEKHRLPDPKGPHREAQQAMDQAFEQLARERSQLKQEQEQTR